MLLHQWCPSQLPLQFVREVGALLPMKEQLKKQDRQDVWAEVRIFESWYFKREVKYANEINISFGFNDFRKLL